MKRKKLKIGSTVVVKKALQPYWGKHHMLVVEAYIMYGQNQYIVIGASPSSDVNHRVFYFEDDTIDRRYGKR